MITRRHFEEWSLEDIEFDAFQMSYELIFISEKGDLTQTKINTEWFDLALKTGSLTDRRRIKAKLCQVLLDEPEEQSQHDLVD